MTAAAHATPGGKRLDKPGDFPGMAIHEQGGAKGKVIRIRFRNREFGTLREFVVRVAFIVITSLALPLLVVAGITAEAFGASWLIGVGGTILLIIYLKHRANVAFFVPRIVELDMGEDRLRILKKGRPEIERPLSSMSNLTVEKHPEAEYALHVRQEKGDRTLRDVEKQHCLTGWFGPGGGEQVVLLCRAEWPNRDTLFEVRQAILWTIEQAASSAAPELAQRTGIKPPLD